MTRSYLGSAIAGALLFVAALAFSIAPAVAAEPDAPTTPAPAAAPAPEENPPSAPPAAQRGDAGSATQFVQDIYGALAAGDAKAFAAAIGPEALLDRMLAGLATRPSERWRNAAVERLGNNRVTLAGALADVLAGAKVRALPAQPGPAGMSWVGVRIYLPQSETWHRVLVSRVGISWRVADIQTLDAGEELSAMALGLLANPADDKPLPTASFLGALGLPLGTMILALVAGILLGLVLARARQVIGLDGRPRPAMRSPLFWLAVVLCTLGGAVFFCVRLGHFLNEQSAVDEIVQHEASHRLVQAQKVEDALRLWRENQMALTFKAGLMATSGNVNPQAAEDFLTAFSQTQPPPPAAFFYLSEFEERREQWTKAADAWVKLSELLGGDGLALCSAAQDLARARDFRGADGDLAAAEKAAGGLDAWMLIRRAAVRARQKKAAEAVADLRAARASKQLPAIILYLQVQSNRTDFELLMKDRAFVEFMTELEKALPRRPMMQKSEGEE